MIRRRDRARERRYWEAIRAGYLPNVRWPEPHVPPQSSSTRRYQVTTRVNGRVVSRHDVDDPFVRHHVYVGWRDLLKSLFSRRRRLEVVVILGADDATTAAVMRLNQGTRGADCG